MEPLEAMTAELARFAPDGSAAHVDGRVGLAHALLRTAPEAERQPTTLDGAVWIVADARIDARAELVRSLRSEGREVRAGAPDAELVLHAYHAWRERCAERLLGDFAFAIWDAPRRMLVCARDHFGVVPLVYATPPGCLVVSNSLAAVRRHPGISGALNESALADFLLFHVNTDLGSTTFADVRSVPPAHTLAHADGETSLRRYWQLPEDGSFERARPGERVERFRAAFDAAVADRLRTSRAGTHLSGGLDSTSVAASARRALSARGEPFDLRAYTIEWESVVAEHEGRLADEVVRALGIAHERLTAEEFLRRPPEREPAHVFPEPCVIPNQHPELEITRRVASFSRTLLTGFGGDPLLAGGTAGRLGQLARTPWRDVVGAPGLLRAYRFAPQLGLRAALRRRRGVEPPPLPPWLDPGFAARTSLRERWRQRWLATRELTGVRAMLAPLWVSLFQWGHPGFLGVPRKAVYPFFDLRLVDTVLRTPPFPWREHKLLLREAMADALPEPVRGRRKTPLYAGRDAAPRDHPSLLLAREPEGLRWRRELVTSEALAPYVDGARAAALLTEPLPPWERAVLDNALPLAYWLERR